MMIVGCGQRKGACAAEARELYTGSLFVAARRHCEASGERWFIVSAKHGLLLPQTVIEPYEARLPSWRGDVRRALIGTAGLLIWTARVWDGIAPWLGEGERLTIFAGKDYAEPIALHARAVGVEVETPLAGLTIGQRLAWFSRSARGRENLSCRGSSKGKENIG